ncbi:MAG TPA: anti-sigma factor domain-containing protein [Candidatus Limnocylindrales bacterium]|nr:anti-sigma factor domain-containing protein [Candidatus Limnocylindrales bacterium]
MKAVVVEVKNGYAALLQDDGIVVKLKNSNFKIGDVVNLKEKTVRSKKSFSAMVAVAAMFIMLMSGGVYAYLTPYYYVSIDVNPSVLMEVNIFERVIGVEVLHEGVAAVLEELDLTNKDIEDAISVVVANLAEAGYFDEEGGSILIAAAARNDDHAEHLAEELQGAVEEEIVENGLEAEVSAGVTGYEMVQQAKGWGLTPGKYNIITNLLGIPIESQEEADGYIATPVRDLMAIFTATKGSEGRGTAEEARESAEEARESAEEGRETAEEARESAEETAANAQNDEENGEPDENTDLEEQNAAGEAEQAGRQEGNAAVDTPASEKKAPNAGAVQNNVTIERPERPEMPEVPSRGGLGR